MSGLFDEDPYRRRPHPPKPRQDLGNDWFFDKFDDQFDRNFKRGFKAVIGIWIALVSAGLVLLGVVIWAIITIVNHVA
jgi:hypothetical protein